MKTRLPCAIAPVTLLLCLLVAIFQVACSGDSESTGAATEATPSGTVTVAPPAPTEETSTATPATLPTAEASSRGTTTGQTPSPLPTPTPSTIRRAEPTTTPAPLPFARGELNFPNPPVSSLSSGKQREPIDFDIGETTLWRDVIGKLGDAEVDCIQGELGAERYKWVLERPAMQGFLKGMITDEPWAEVWQVLLWSCLEQGTALDLFWANIEGRTEEIIDSMRGGLFGMSEEVELVLAEECVRGLVAYTDFSRFVAGGLPAGSGESRAHRNDEGGIIVLALGLFSCSLPQDLSEHLSEEYQGFSFSSEYDISWNDVADKVTVAESSCIREVLGLADEPAAGQGVFDDRTEPWEVSAWGCLSQENAAHLFEASDPYLGSPFPMERVLEISGDNSECVREALHKVDYPVLAAGGIPGTGHQKGAPFYAILTALAYCQTEALSGYENYHNDIVAFVPLPPGVRASGSVDYTGDVDVFLVQIEEGKFYQVDVLTGSLQAPLAGMQDSAFGFSDTYFKREGSDRLWPITCYSTSKTQEFPMEWRAERSGDQLVIVRGGSCDDMGTYTVSLSVSEEAEDDHGDSRGDATSIAVGETVSGVLGYGDDADFLTFTVMGEQTYEIEGTWEDGSPLRFNVYDDLGNRLGSTHDRPDEPVRIWLPHDYREYVASVGIGEHAKDRRRSVGFSLTVSLSDINDDYANTGIYATYIVPGERIESSIDYPGDSDNFLLRGEVGESYRIEVTAASSDSWIGVGTFDPQKDDYVGGTSIIINDFGRNSLNLWVGSIRDEVGSYTLVVSPSYIVDDHGDQVEDATRISRGTPIAGNLEHAHDWDILCFPVVQGDTYEVELVMGSLKNARLGIYDSSIKSHSAYTAGRQPDSPLRLTLTAATSEDYCVHVDVYEPDSTLYDPDSIGDYTITVRTQ